MAENFDREKIIDCMFDPVTSTIIAELENGAKKCSFLATTASIPESDVLDRLTYLIEHGFIHKRCPDDNDICNCTLEADTDKLSSIVSDNSNFDGAVDGLEKMDSYLN